MATERTKKQTAELIVEINNVQRLSVLDQSEPEEYYAKLIESMKRVFFLATGREMNQVEIDLLLECENSDTYDLYFPPL